MAWWAGWRVRRVQCDVWVRCMSVEGVVWVRWVWFCVCTVSGSSSHRCVWVSGSSHRRCALQVGQAGIMYSPGERSKPVQSWQRKCMQRNAPGGAGFVSSPVFPGSGSLSRPYSSRQTGHLSSFIPGGALGVRQASDKARSRKVWCCMSVGASRKKTGRETWSFCKAILASTAAAVRAGWWGFHTPAMYFMISRGA